MVDESVTLRYEGPARGLRSLRRRLELSGLDVWFSSQGIDREQQGPRGPDLWFQLVVSGPGCAEECRAVARNWSEAGALRVDEPAPSPAD
jgi:hypothetical protein